MKSRDPFRADQPVAFLEPYNQSYHPLEPMHRSATNFQLGAGPQPMAAQGSPSFDSAVCLSDENENAPGDEERSVSGDTIRMSTPEIEEAIRNARLGRSAV